MRYALILLSVLMLSCKKKKEDPPPPEPTALVKITMSSDSMQYAMMVVRWPGADRDSGFKSQSIERYCKAGTLSVTWTCRSNKSPFPSYGINREVYVNGVKVHVSSGAPTKFTTTIAP